MMNDSPSLSFDWALWFQWMMATTLGWVLGRFILPNLAVVVIGIGMGIFQWFILQHRIRNAWKWIVATLIGWSVGASIVSFLMQDSIEFFAGIVLGLSVGIAQWVVLRQAVRFSAWWIIINIVAWSSGIGVLPGVVLTGVIVGAVTGIAIELLLRLPQPGLTQAEETLRAQRY